MRLKENEKIFTHQTSFFLFPELSIFEVTTKKITSKIISSKPR